MKKVSIIGLGLMGGSLGMALKRAGKVENVCGYARREENRTKALEMGAVDEVMDTPEKAVDGADVVVFCLPVLTIPGVLKSCIGHFSDNCVVTDVGSTKEELVSELSSIFEGSNASFVGSHPICGSEKTGIEVARADLYEGAVTVIVAEDERIRGLWEGVGSRVMLMDSSEHDELIAKTSHLPHLVASMLADHVLKAGDDKVKSLCGTGFCDVTRIAGGSEEIWHDIIKTNRKMVLKELKGFEQQIKAVEGMVQDGDFEKLKEFFQKAREARSEIG